MSLEVGRMGAAVEEKEEEKKEEKFPHMCESIGHRPLRGRCPKRKKRKKKKRCRYPKVNMNSFSVDISFFTSNGEFSFVLSRKSLLI